MIAKNFLPLSIMERTAIFPGSFDPFTRGHAAIVEESLKLFDKVIIGIGNNSMKHGLTFKLYVGQARPVGVAEHPIATLLAPPLCLGYVR